MRFTLILWLLSGLFFQSVHAQVDVIPFMKRVLVGVDPMKYPQGLCPGNPLPKVPAPVTPYSGLTARNVVMRLKRDRRHNLALQASAAIYDLPDYNPQSAKTFLAKMKSFLAELPAGYEFYFYISEPEAGLKYMVLRPLAPGEAWVISVAGTQSMMDWIVDLGLGSAQLAKLSGLEQLLTTCQYLDESNRPLAAQPFILTGHSLGGGLAQALAYEIQLQRLRKSLSPIAMELVTFNGFGARELVEKSGAFQPEVVPYLNATNYFVHGDPVSRIGHHLGPTAELFPPGEMPGSSVSAVEALHRHSIATIEQIAARKTPLYSGLSTAISAAPLTLPNFTALGNWSVGIPKIVDQTLARESTIVDILKAVVEQVRREGASKDVKNYLKQLINSEIIHLHQPGPRPMMNQALSAQLEALARSF